MSAEIVNLRRVRKAKRRDTAMQEAAERRVLFGRTGAERQRQALDTTRAKHHLDGHRLAGKDESDVP